MAEIILSPSLEVAAVPARETDVNQCGGGDSLKSRRYQRPVLVEDTNEISFKYFFIVYRFSSIPTAERFYEVGGRSAELI